MSLLQKLKTLLIGGSSRESRSGDPSSSASGPTATPNTSSEQAVKASSERSSPTDTASPSIEDAESVETVDETPDTGTPRTESEPEDAAGIGDDASDATGDRTPVSAISGIGPAYSDRLESIGIETVEQLAAADPDDIADQTDISIGRVSNWIERAQEA